MAICKLELAVNGILEQSTRVQEYGLVCAQVVNLVAMKVNLGLMREGEDGGVVLGKDEGKVVCGRN